MRPEKTLITFLLIFSFGLINTQSATGSRESVYQLKPNDPEACFFTPENFNIKADGKTDVSDALQDAINRVKTEKNFGIVFIPEGKYLISKTIYVPGAIRLIGYGKTRPEIILAKNSPGYQKLEPDNRYPEKYMIFFTGGMVAEGRQPGDAGAGTFYSAISNIDMENCLFDNVKDAGVILSREQHALTQVNLINIDCRNVPVLAMFRQSGGKIEPNFKTYKVKEFTYGLVMDDIATDSEFKTITKIEPLQVFPAMLERDISSLPPMEKWVNI